MNEEFLNRPDLLMYAKMAQRKAGYIAGQVELTSECSQHCIACDSWRSHVKGTIKGTLYTATILSLVKQLNAMPTFEHLSFTGGDPQDWHDPICSFIGFEDLLCAIKLEKPKFSLQVNTALIKPVNVKVWNENLQRVRVSLDSIRRETYCRLRGDDRDPEEILERMEELAHPGLATMTCVSDGNIDEIPEIIARLNRMKNPPRKAMFLAVLGMEVNPYFWKKYELFKKIEVNRIQLSFQEDVMAVREFCDSPGALQVPCYTGGITFHIKCNGDVYPCCLIGGEAVKTQEHMKIGNIIQGPLSKIQEEYEARCFYKKGGPCSEVCQWKQLMINRIAHAAKDVILTMP